MKRLSLSRELDCFWQVARVIGPLLAMGWLTSAAFNPETRRKIGERDHWTCQHKGSDGQHDCDRSFQSGYMVTAAHLPRLHGQRDNDPSAGRMLCVIHHAAEEFRRNNARGAAAQLATGVYTNEYAKMRGGNVFPDLFQLMRAGASGLIQTTQIEEDWHNRTPVR